MTYLEAGYGHADEQLFSPVYFAMRDRMEPYFADYQQMITNYRYVYENTGVTQRLVIPKSAAAGDWATCAAACRFLLASIEKGVMTASALEVNELRARLTLCE
jgi:hypothetical protein